MKRTSLGKRNHGWLGIIYQLRRIIFLSLSLLPPQSPSKALLADGIGENAHLTDNWDDAEGYYSKSSVNVQYTTFRIL